MTKTATEQLHALRTLVEQAKSVPMSASCLVNRAEAVQALNQVVTSLEEEMAQARRDSGIEKVEDAHAEAARIIAEAREQASRLVSIESVHAVAVRQAEHVTESTRAETDALKREADAYVDQRMAELEASMSKTLNQVKTMRARLSERSNLD